MRTRFELIRELAPSIEPFRFRQIDQALFAPECDGWNNISSLPYEMRELIATVQWMSLSLETMRKSASNDTYKALLKLEDGLLIESVLMRNARGSWTVCASSQVGCAMGCAFCATGRMGLKRNLTSDEITDQLRFWLYFLFKNPEIGGRISNVVMMGMGEPLANYDNLKYAMNKWLAYTELGHTNITVSSVGFLPRLEQMLSDMEFPHIRMAISLHSAIPETRKAIVPTSFDDFLPKLADWSKRYLAKFGNRRHHLTFEYVMLSGINDNNTDAIALAKYVNGIGNVRVNLIPYNFTDMGFEKSVNERVIKFQKTLERRGVIATRRRPMGDDISAACGQLAVKKTS